MNAPKFPDVCGEVYSAEFISSRQAEKEDREPGTYITIRVANGTSVPPGKARISFIDTENGVQ